MNNSAAHNGIHLLLDVATAAELMTPDPISLRSSATVIEAVAVLTDRGYRAAPVIDEAGHAIGVVSGADIIIHDREKTPSPAGQSRSSNKPDPTLVRDIMTPAVFSVFPDTPAFKVIEEIAAMNVQQLFVVDKVGVPVGMISAVDILKHLRALET